MRNKLSEQLKRAAPGSLQGGGSSLRDTEGHTSVSGGPGSTLCVIVPAVQPPPPRPPPPPTHVYLLLLTDSRSCCGNASRVFNPSVSQRADSCVWLENNESIPRRWAHTYHKFLDANWGFSRIRTSIWEVSYLQLLIQQCRMKLYSSGPSTHCRLCAAAAALTKWSTPPCLAAQNGLLTAELTPEQSLHQCDSLVHLSPLKMLVHLKLCFVSAQNRTFHTHSAFTHSSIILFLWATDIHGVFLPECAFWWAPSRSASRQKKSRTGPKSVRMWFLPGRTAGWESEGKSAARSKKCIVCVQCGRLQNKKNYFMAFYDRKNQNKLVWDSPKRRLKSRRIPLSGSVSVRRLSPARRSPENKYKREKCGNKSPPQICSFTRC